MLLLSCPLVEQPAHGPVTKKEQSVHGIELAYVAMGIENPETVSALLGDVVSIVRGADSPKGGTSWHNDDKVHRIIVEEGPPSRSRGSATCYLTPNASVPRESR